jgi:hypothetical protein
MSYCQRIVALVSGIMLLPALFGFGLVLGAILTAIPIPWGDYERELFSVEVALFSLVWSWITLRWLARPPRIAIWWCLGGLLVGFACLPFVDAVQSHYSCLDFVRQNPREIRDCSFLANLDYGWLFSPWPLPLLLAVISGLAAAAAIVLRSERTAIREAHA